MVSVIPRYAKVIWEKWNIRSLILLSLFLQVNLILLAPFRKRTSNIWIIFLIWTAYLLADFVALFALGLISNKQQDNYYNYSSPSCDLMALWAPFCLLHLGGPDTITAFSVEDNALWVRHLLGLIFQVSVSLYVFLQSLPTNKLLLPISSLFVAGIIKYTERTRALFLANFDPFRAEPGPNYAKLVQEYATIRENNVPVRIRMARRQQRESIIGNVSGNPGDVTVVRHAHHLFEIFRGLVIDQLVILMSDRNESREYFHHRDPTDAFKVLSAELNFFYQVLYTKALVTHCKWGYVFRVATSLSLLFSFFFFFVNDSAKHSFARADVDITYILFGGAIALDTLAFIFMIFSDWTVVKLGKRLEHSYHLDWIFNKYLRLKRPNWQLEKSENYCSSNWARNKFVFPRWSLYVYGFNLIKYCVETNNTVGYCRSIYIKKSKALGLTEFRERTKFVTKDRLSKDLWTFIFEEMRKKSMIVRDVATAKKMSSTRKDWVLKSNHDADITNLLMLYFVEVDYAQSLLSWHVATEICYNIDSNVDEPAKEFSKVLSDYMLYLLHLQPTLLSSVAGIGEIRFGDTCAEAKRFFDKAGLLKVKEACLRILEMNTDYKPARVKGTKSKSVLFDACILAKELMNNQNLKQNKWESVSRVWVDLLSYAACQCKSKLHLQLLGRGGELITYVWLLLAHFGIGEQLHVTDQDHHATAKLLVGI